MGNAYIRRPFPEFRLSAAWYGGNFIRIETLDGQVVEEIPIKAAGPRTATEAFEQVRQELNEAASA